VAAVKLGYRQFDSEASGLAIRPLSLLADRLSQLTPGVAADAGAWISGLSKTGNACEYFSGGRSILLLLPRFLAEASGRPRDLTFELDLAYSSINAYYFVRLIDDVVDHERSACSRLLPLVGFFHAEFQSSYIRYFRPDHSFWDHFHHIWGKMAEATIEQTRRTSLSNEEFIRLSAGRSGGVKIPIAALCEFYCRPDLFGPWCKFFDAFATWSQMLDDMIDWAGDSAQGITTYFLSEADRHRTRDEAVAPWILQQGLEWGHELAITQSRALRILAEELKNDRLVQYIDDRREQVEGLWRQLRPQLPALLNLALALDK
jgi:hypothetical protein